MTAKELLRLCRSERREICILREKREFLAASLLPKAMQIKAVVVQGGDPDPVGERMAEVADLDRELERQIGRLLEHEINAHRLIRETLDDSMERAVVELYYLSLNRQRLYTWDEVAAEIGVSPRWIFNRLPGVYEKLSKKQFVQ